MVKPKTKALILRCLQEGPKTYQEIMAETGLSYATVINALKELIEEGAVLRLKKPKGRKSYYTLPRYTEI